MQPHSMAMVSMCTYFWARPHNEHVKVKSAQIKVEYQDATGAYKSNYYNLSNFQESSDHRELRAYIMRSNGGISCEITARRNSLSEGAEITMTHGQQHVAGLREIFKLYSNSVSGGRHENSRKYTDFSGDVQFRDRLKLYCGLKTTTGRTITVPYDLRVESIDTIVITQQPEKAYQPIDNLEDGKQGNKILHLFGRKDKAA